MEVNIALLFVSHFVTVGVRLNKSLKSVFLLFSVIYLFLELLCMLFAEEHEKTLQTLTESFHAAQLYSSWMHGFGVNGYVNFNFNLRYRHR